MLFQIGLIKHQKYDRLGWTIDKLLEIFQK